MEKSENDKEGPGELFECTRDAGFRPGSRACCLARPEGRNYHLVRLEERNLCVEQNWPKPVTPRPASFGGDGRRLWKGGPTRYAQTRPAGLYERPPLWPGGRRWTLGNGSGREGTIMKYGN